MANRRAPGTVFGMSVEIKLRVDLDAYRAEYSEPGLTLEDVRDHIAGDLREKLDNAAYTDALVGIDVEVDGWRQ